MNIPVLPASLFCLSLVLSGTGSAADVDRGRTLHEEHCRRCHGDEVYTRPERIVDGLDRLRERVKQCELSNELLWFEEDVEDVIAYLNDNYYQFGIK